MILAFISALLCEAQKVHYIGGSDVLPAPLPREEEAALLSRLAQGDEAAKSRLIEHNLRLVAHIVKKYYGTSAEQDDLISIGTIGLIKAVGTFDYEKGTRFATYAARCIENEILMYFRSKKKMAQDISICEPIDCDKDGNALTLMDIVADERSISECIEEKLGCEKLYQCINTYLTKREREILLFRYGLCGSRAMTQREVAQRLGISRSYVSRIEKKALDILRQHLPND